MWLMGSTTGWVMFLAGVALMVAILMRRNWRYYRKNRKQRRADKKRPSELSAEMVVQKPAALEGQPLADAPPDVLRWQVEMHETARDLKAELDSKLSALQTLVQVADQAATRLETACRRAEELSKQHKT